jgi:hypothetical protein
VGSGVHTGSTLYVDHFWPTVPAPGDCKDGEFGGIKIGRGNRSTRRKPAERPFTGPEPASGISIGVARKAARGWTNRNRIKQWESTIGLKQAK